VPLEISQGLLTLQTKAREAALAQQAKGRPH